MTTWHVLALTWTWEPSVVAGCTALAGAYLGFSGRPLGWGRTLSFMTGVAILLLALDSPLDGLGDRYLFSAHMAQHMLLVLIVPPLLILGIRPAWVRAALAVPGVRPLEHVLRRPAVAWLIGIGTLCTWHVPALYNRALANALVHLAQHLSFLVASTIFWWPVCAPLAELRMPALGAILYLFAASLASSGLGIALTFARPGLYPAYLHPNDVLGVLPVIRGGWSLTPAVDEQVGGLLMWVPGGLVYLCAILATLGRWYREEDEHEMRAGDATPSGQEARPYVTPMA